MLKDVVDLTALLKSEAPLHDNVFPVPVSLPRELYRKAVDLEHDDALEMATYIARALGKTLRAMLPREGYAQTKHQCLTTVTSATQWLYDNCDVPTLKKDYVPVSIALPVQLMGLDWEHWLAVEIGRYAGRCIASTLKRIEAQIGYKPDSLTNALIAEWNDEVEKAVVE